MAELVKHLKGTQDAYEKLPKTGRGGVTPDTLYFTTEFSGDNELNTGRIYLGGTLVGKPSVWEELPEPIHYEMVDLGLPSGLKWADRNVGAASPEAYGDYFMWGSVTPDTDNVCDWEHAPFNGGSSDFDETYFNAHKSEWVTDEGVLKPEYDAAHAIMGGSCRMPTSAEMQELIDGTTQTMEEVNGVKGMRFTSNANGNSIFMPFAGTRNGPSVRGAGDFSFTWTSSLNGVKASKSHSLFFSSGAGSGLSSYDRCGGFVVRGVC